jgi:hypothetical protein
MHRCPNKLSFHMRRFAAALATISYTPNNMHCNADLKIDTHRAVLYVELTALCLL